MNGDLPDRRPWLLSNNFQWGIPIKPINSRPRLKVDLEVELEFLTATYKRPREGRYRSNQDRHGQFIISSKGSADGVWPWRPGWALTWSALDNCSVVEGPPGARQIGSNWVALPLIEPPEGVSLSDKEPSTPVNYLSLTWQMHQKCLNRHEFISALELSHGYLANHPKCWYCQNHLEHIALSQIFSIFLFAPKIYLVVF